MEYCTPSRPSVALLSTFGRATKQFFVSALYTTFATEQDIFKSKLHIVNNSADHPATSGNFGWIQERFYILENITKHQKERRKRLLCIMYTI